jgi:hypothetical protein
MDPLSRQLTHHQRLAAALLKRRTAANLTSRDSQNGSVYRSRKPPESRPEGFFQPLRKSLHGRMQPALIKRHSTNYLPSLTRR